jgi:hypothetical protein
VESERITVNKELDRRELRERERGGGWGKYRVFQKELYNHNYPR